MLFCYIAYGSYIDCVSYIALRQLYLPTASDIAHFVRSCGESGFLSFRHFVPPPSSDGGIFRREQAHRPTFELYWLRQLYCFAMNCLRHELTQVSWIGFAMICTSVHCGESGYSLDHNSPKVNITSAGHITHEVNITHKVHITANKKPPNEWLCLQC